MYVLSRQQDTSEEHEIACWSVYITEVVSKRWAEVTCRCGEKSCAANAYPEAQQVYRDLLDVAVLKIACPLAVSEIGVRSLL